MLCCLGCFPDAFLTFCLAWICRMDCKHHFPYKDFKISNIQRCTEQQCVLYVMIAHVCMIYAYLRVVWYIHIKEIYIITCNELCFCKLVNIGPVYTSYKQSNIAVHELCIILYYCFFPQLKLKSDFEKKLVYIFQYYKYSVLLQNTCKIEYSQNWYKS